MPVPFTVTADVDLGARVAPYVVAGGGDVQIAAGEVPMRLEGGETPPGATYELAGRRLLLRPPNGLRILVEDGARITYAPQPAHSDREVALFLLGTAWGALAWQRGLVPLHASAVLAKGGVHAFTGASGAGKSTLAAALSARGRPFFADDTLVVDPAAEGIVCYAGQKDLKLWGKALALTGCASDGPVREEPGFDKHFAQARHQADVESASLATLVLLQADSRVATGTIAPIAGSAAVMAMLGAMYRPALGTAFLGRPALFRAATMLAGRVAVHRFTRAMDVRAFADEVALVDGWIGDARWT